MATLTITGSNNNYAVSSDPMDVPNGGELDIVVPVGPPVGCLICLNKDLGTTKSHLLSGNKKFDMKTYPVGTSWSYTIWDPSTASCPSDIAANPPHVIQITSGM